eukprot:Clim_evm191s157 gene=Clim_evmTU191s157
MNGKKLGSTTSYTQTDLQTLGEESELYIGKWMVEVQNRMNPQEYHSGKCFLSGSGSCSVPEPLLSRKATIYPVRVNGIGLKPRHDPNREGALVMPKPSNDTKAIDVVIDPVLGDKLMDHQRDGVTKLYHSVMGYHGYGSGVILADDMGLGKTLQTITVIWTLLKQSPVPGTVSAIRSALILCPSSLVRNWNAEFGKWLGKTRIEALCVHQDQDIRSFYLSRRHEVLICGYEMFRRHAAKIQSARFDLVVCDESHRLKNSNIQLSKSLNAMAIKKRILITGTPIQNQMADFFVQCDLANPGVLGDYATFKRLYEDPILMLSLESRTPAVDELGRVRKEALQEITDSFFIRRTGEVLQSRLKSKTDVLMFVKLSQAQEDLYQEQLRASDVRQCIESCNNASALSCILRLRKICGGTSKAGVDDLDSENEEAEILNRLEPGDIGKLQTLRQIIDYHRKEYNPYKLVVVSHFTSCLDIIEAMCKEEGHHTVRLDGTTTVKKRQDMVDRFNNPLTGSTVFLLSSKAGGVGLNLVGGRTIVLYDIDWNPASDLQAMARVHRQGQENEVHVVRLISTGTIEEKILQRQEFKKSIGDKILTTRGVQKDKTFSQEELREIFRYQEQTLCDTHDLLRKHDCLLDQRDTTCKEPTSAVELTSYAHAEYVNTGKDGFRIEPHRVPLVNHVLRNCDAHVSYVMYYKFHGKCDTKDNNKTL